MAMLRRMPEVQEVLRLPRCAPARASTPTPTSASGPPPELNLGPPTQASAGSLSPTPALALAAALLLAQVCGHRGAPRRSDETRAARAAQS